MSANRVSYTFDSTLETVNSAEEAASRTCPVVRMAMRVDVAVGTILSGYRIQRLLGRGGTGAEFRRNAGRAGR